MAMLETPVTSSPIVSNFLANLPAYRLGISPLLRGIEIGLTHGFFLPGPFIKLGPLRNSLGISEFSGCLSASGLVIILTVCLSLYGSVTFQQPQVLTIKTLNGRVLDGDLLLTASGWSDFSAGWLLGGMAGVTYCYFCTQRFPFY